MDVEREQLNLVGQYLSGNFQCCLFQQSQLIQEWMMAVKLFNRVCDFDGVYTSQKHAFTTVCIDTMVYNDGNALVPFF